MKILILVLSYDDSGIYTEFYKTQKQTWDSLHVDEVETYYYFGNNLQNQLIGNNIYTDVTESLINCGKKSIEAFKIVLDMDFDFVFRTNSSSYVDKLLLKKHLENKPRNNFYSGVVGNHFGIPFCSGSGFVLTKDLVQLLVENESNLNFDLIDDVCFGEFISSKNIPLIDSHRFDIIQNVQDIDLGFFHYRLKTKNRFYDINNMKLIYNKKIKKNNMEKINSIYEKQCETPSDINEHLPTLFRYAKECKHITEMGVRWVSSTWPLLLSEPKKMFSYDIVKHPQIDDVLELTKVYEIDYKFIEADVLKVEIEETELLFIDTLHTYNQLTRELELHSNKCSKYIILHDTTYFGESDEIIYEHASNEIKNVETKKQGLWNAVLDFLDTKEGQVWEVQERYTNNNGLTILKNKNYKI